MLPLKYLLLRMGWGLLGCRGRWAEEFQQGRPVSPPGADSYSSGKHAGETATALDNCKMGVPRGLAAAASRQGHCGDAQRDGRYRVSQTSGTRPLPFYPARHWDHAAGGIPRDL
jgi:hypothetical protein